MTRRTMVALFLGLLFSGIGLGALLEMQDAVHDKGMLAGEGLLLRASYATAMGLIGAAFLWGACGFWFEALEAIEERIGYFKARVLGGVCFLAGSTYSVVLIAGLLFGLGGRWFIDPAKVKGSMEVFGIITLWMTTMILASCAGEQFGKAHRWKLESMTTAPKKRSAA